MNIKVGKNLVEISDKVNALPKELVDFAIKNRSTNGNFYWTGNGFILENIKLLVRKWGWSTNTYAFSIEFVFSISLRQLQDL